MGYLIVNIILIYCLFVFAGWFDVAVLWNLANSSSILSFEGRSFDHCNSATLASYPKRHFLFSKAFRLYMQSVCNYPVNKGLVLFYHLLIGTTLSPVFLNKGLCFFMEFLCAIERMYFVLTTTPLWRKLCKIWMKKHFYVNEAISNSRLKII